MTTQAPPHATYRLGRDDDLTPALIRAVNLVLRHRRLVTLIPTAVAVVVAIMTFLQPRSYTAQASFVPQAAQSAQSQFAGLAERFGFDVGSSASMAASPGFFKSLLESDELLGDVARTQFTVPVGGRVTRSALPPLLEVEEPTKIRELFATVDELRRITSVDVSTVSGVVDIRVRAPSESLSVQIARRMLELVNEFNLRKRQEQAAAERAFMQERLDVALRELRAAEDNLQSFLERNRQYQGDPRLVFAYDRARRNLDMKQGIYNTIAQNYEQASLNAIRDTPVITTVQTPEVRPTPDRRGLVSKTVLAFVVTAMMTIVLAVGLGVIGMTRTVYPDDFQDFHDLRTAAWKDLTRPFRRIGPREQS